MPCAAASLDRKLSGGNRLIPIWDLWNIQGKDPESLPRRTAAPKRLYSPIVLDLPAVGTDSHNGTALSTALLRFENFELDRGALTRRASRISSAFGWTWSSPSSET